MSLLGVTNSLKAELNALWQKMTEWINPLKKQISVTL